MPETIGRATVNTGGTSLPVDLGGNEGEGSGCHQLGEGGRTRAVGFLERTPGQCMCLVDGHVDAQKGKKGIPRHRVS